MKKVTCALIILCMIFCLLAGCSTKWSNSHLIACGSYGVPGMFACDLKGDACSCEILETDDYGRILFSYTTEHLVTGNVETAYVICQQYGSKQVYFYEDICYCYLSEELQALKSANDWGAPLDSSKMSSRTYNVTADGYLQSNSQLNASLVKENCCKKLQLSSENITELCFLDADNAGNGLYWLDTSTEGGFYVIASTDYDMAFMEYESTQASMENLPLFKAACGWGYPGE